MRERLIVIPGWSGSPRRDWMPYIQKVGDLLDFATNILEMPNPHSPELNSWVDCIKGAVGIPLQTDVILGHSFGAGAAYHYLQRLPEGQRIGHMISVAGVVALKKDARGVEYPRRTVVAKKWMSHELDLVKVRAGANKHTSIYSDEDPFLDVVSNAYDSYRRLGADTIILRGMAHFNVTTLPYLSHVLVKHRLQSMSGLVD